MAQDAGDVSTSRHATGRAEWRANCRKQFNNVVLISTLSKMPTACPTKPSNPVPQNVSFSGFHFTRAQEANRTTGGLRGARVPFITFGSSRCCTRVCLSALSDGLGFRVIPAPGAWRPAVPALAGFGLPPRLPASPFANSKQSASAPSEKLASLGLRAAPFAPGRPHRAGHERKTNKCSSRDLCGLNFGT
jgi:hypothetical protein